MLKKEDLLKVDVLKELSEEAILAITTLSKNDEDAIVGPKFKQIHDDLDAVILEISGEAKGSRKTTEYAKDVFGKMKDDNADVDIYKKELDTANATIKELKKSGGGDESLKKAISDSEAKILEQKTLIDQLRGDLESKKTEHDKELLNLKFDGIFSKSLEGISFKKGLPKEAIEALVESAKAKTMKTGEARLNGEGQINFYGEDNMVIQAGADKLRVPLTGRDVFLDHLGPIIEKGREQGGGGASGKTPTSVSSFANKREALAEIRKRLGDEGIASGTEEFSKRQREYAEEFGVSELPDS